MLDASQLDVAPLTKKEVEELQATLSSIGNPLVRIRVKEGLSSLMDVPRSRIWGSSGTIARGLVLSAGVEPLFNRGSESN